MNPAAIYILEQSEPFRSLLFHVQLIIEHVVPQAEMKYKYKIPFYYLHDKPFCYLNVTKGYVDVGFWKGNQIDIHKDHLVTEGRKMIKSLRYRTMEDVADEVLIDVLKTTMSSY